MTIDFSLSTFLLGCLGALLHESLRWIGLKERARLPIYFRKVHYWLLTLLLIAIGGVVVVLVGAGSPIQAVGIGIAAPSILSRLAILAPRELVLANSDDQSRKGPVPPPPEIGDWARG
jgi:hypothetical protein